MVVPIKRAGMINEVHWPRVELDVSMWVAMATSLIDGTSSSRMRKGME